MISRRDVQELASSLRQSRIPAPAIRIEYRLFEEKPVGKIGQIKISIDGKREQHKEKHFHARLNSQASGTFRIPDGYPFGSSFSSKDENLITDWARSHSIDLENDWDDIEAGENPRVFIEEI